MDEEAEKEPTRWDWTLLGWLEAAAPPAWLESLSLYSALDFKELPQIRDLPNAHRN